MRIGILTLTPHANYGGILQAYALQTVLERMGHKVEVIDVLYTVPDWKMFLRYTKRIILKYLLGKRNTIVFVEKESKRELAVVSQYTLQFVNRYIHIRTYKKYTDIRESDYDAIVVGSDQVWRPGYFSGNIKHAFLDFAKDWKNIKRIAYAASFGTDKWLFMKRQERVCGQLLQLFDAVSVRETSAVKICEEHWGVIPTPVLDPTLLLPKEVYEQLVQGAGTPKSPGTLLCYVLDENEEKKSIIQEIANQRHLVPFRVNSRYEDHSAPLQERIQPPVEQWLRGFMDAEFVVTDSFHGCVFSIIFNKPFFVIGNSGRGMARFNTLITQFGLEKNIRSDDVFIQMVNDWDVINQKRDELRVHSLGFLKSINV